MSDSGCQTQLAGIECDGRMISMARDPPGQRSVYIPPGDTERETYRLATFKDFPSHVPVDVRRLASGGFYFTGYKDRVKCFSCGQSQQEWTVGDNPDDPGWHRHDCQHALGQDASNVPLLSFIQHPGMTGCAKPHTHLAQSDPNRPSRSLEAGERPIRFIAKMEISLPMTISLFPCSNPVNPHMRSEESRLQTFLDHSSSWPAHRIRATPRQIANAGMYYLGVRDRVKCWYCNGGLQNWERDDDPWEEHAKWFPMCEFVLQRKGVDFVHNIVSRFPNLRRPMIRNPYNIAQINRITFSGAGNGSNVQRSPFRCQRLQTSGPVIIDPREEQRERKRKVDEMMTTSEVVSNAKQMGFEEKTTRAALRKRLESCNQPFSNLENLVDAILALDSSNLPEDVDTTEPEPEPGTEAFPSVSSITRTQGVREIRRLKEARMCKSCHHEQANMVFMPCGHLACCPSCGGSLENCPVCHSTVPFHSSSWTAHKIRATPRQIANAGTYYLGVRDQAKGWYCNGGLQNWERDDDPLEEHAKWFPMCEFVLQQKGPDYVHGIVSRFPNLRRPIIRNPANPTAQLRHFQSESRGNPNAGPTIIDRREETRSLEWKVDEEMSSSELVELAKLMGFDERAIRTSLKRKYEATGNGFSSLEIFVESILAIEEESASNRSKEGRSTSATAEATPTTSASNLSTTSGLQEIRRLQKERMCKVCGNEQASVVLIPCGHIACCVGCAENASTCPICRSRIRSFISTNEAGHDDETYRSEKERMCTNCGEDVARQRLIPQAQFDCCDRCDQKFSAERIFRVRMDLN
ncbi:E3 ubiquitin-protein ligase XIAP-like [Clavelina lepadiformis]|uniref:E3 ubiquitin-protein ligase XIAP-like n=1 Tax=Clavelina lepadiformis TaxID=159417 RepID=UPI0040415A1B